MTRTSFTNVSLAIIPIVTLQEALNDPDKVKWSLETHKISSACYLEVDFRREAILGAGTFKTCHLAQVQLMPHPNTLKCYPGLAALNKGEDICLKQVYKGLVPYKKKYVSSILRLLSLTLILKVPPKVTHSTVMMELSNSK